MESFIILVVSFNPIVNIYLLNFCTFLLKKNFLFKKLMKRIFKLKFKSLLTFIRVTKIFLIIITFYYLRNKNIL